MKRKVHHVRIEPAANGGHIVHTSYEPQPSKGKEPTLMYEDDKPSAFGNLNDTMNHVRSVLGGSGEKEPDDKGKGKHSWHA